MVNYKEKTQNSCRYEVRRNYLGLLYQHQKEDGASQQWGSISGFENEFQRRLETFKHLRWIVLRKRLTVLNH